MAGRIIIKPFRLHGGNGNIDTDGSGLYWRATPEFMYAGMPKSGKPHFGTGLTPWLAVSALASYLPASLRSEVAKRTEEDIYLMPDCPNFDWRILEMDGEKPDKAEWLRQRQWYNTFGNLNGYFKMRAEA